MEGVKTSMAAGVVVAEVSGGFKTPLVRCSTPNRVGRQ